MNAKNFDSKIKAKLEQDIDPLSFAFFMKASRISLGLTQEAFGKKVGLSRANICDIEKGRHLVGIPLAVKVARKVGFSEKIALQACLQDQVIKAGFQAKVVVA